VIDIGPEIAAFVQCKNDDCILVILLYLELQQSAANWPPGVDVDAR
jgi:hypothetical protein